MYKLILRKSLVVSAVLGLSGCTDQVPGSFRFLQQTQNFSATQRVNTKIDLLWVVDNSSSMDIHQQKLRDGFQAFATKYLLPTWDIRVAVITSDTYMANPAFSTYLNTTIASTAANGGYLSNYLKNLTWLSNYPEPASDPTMVNTVTGRLDHGITYGNTNPLWGSNYAKLRNGIHDGPMPGFCFEGMPYFYSSLASTQCTIRDNPFTLQNLCSALGTSSANMAQCVTSNANALCLSPGTGQSSLSQCVNTLANDTVHSGSAIISTIPPSGTKGDSAWITKIVNNFKINASVGSSGSQSERGLGSVLQLLNDNETTDTAFFRKGSLRGIIFLSDEDDQSLTYPAPLPSNFSPNWGYACDQASMLANNGGSSTITSIFCCANGCQYGSEGTSCTPKTIDNGYTYTLSVCVNQSKLIPVATVKQNIDSFFTTLDGSGSTGDPNYFVAAITPTNSTSLQAIAAARKTTDNNLGLPYFLQADRGDRYIALANLVGRGSTSLDIGLSDYTPVLNEIGANIIKNISSYTLSRAPTGTEQMVVTIIHGDGSSTPVSSSEFSVTDKVLTFTNSSFVLGLASTDQVSINYQPKTAF